MTILSDAARQEIDSRISEALRIYFTRKDFPGLTHPLRTRIVDGPATDTPSLDDFCILANTDSGDVGITLPKALGTNQVLVVVHKNPGYTTTISPVLGDSIGPSGPVTLTKQYEFMVFVSDNIDHWNIVSRGKYNGPTGTAGGDLTGTYPDPPLKTNLKLASFGITIDGGGGVPTTGSKGFVVIPYACTITNWYIVGDAAGSAVVDLKRSGTSIVGGSGNKPTLSSAQRANAAVASWTSTDVAANDEIEFNLDSATTVTRLNLIVEVTKT